MVSSGEAVLACPLLSSAPRAEGALSNLSGPSLPRVRLVPLGVLRGAGGPVCSAVLRDPQVLQLQAERRPHRGLPAALLPDAEQLRLHRQEVLRPDPSAGAWALAFQDTRALRHSASAGGSCLSTFTKSPRCKFWMVWPQDGKRACHIDWFGLFRSSSTLYDLGPGCVSVGKLTFKYWVRTGLTETTFSQDV